MSIVKGTLGDLLGNIGGLGGAIDGLGRQERQPQLQFPQQFQQEAMYPGKMFETFAPSIDKMKCSYCKRHTTETHKPCEGCGASEYIPC